MTSSSVLQSWFFGRRPLASHLQIQAVACFYQLVAKGFLLVVAVAAGRYRMARAERLQAETAAAAQSRG